MLVLLPLLLLLRLLLLLLPPPLPSFFLAPCAVADMHSCAKSRHACAACMRACTPTEAATRWW